jgi:hypothetical protein
MKTIFRILVIFIFTGKILSGQVVLHTTRDTTKIKTGIKVSVLNPHGKTSTPYAGHSIQEDSVQQAFKINPLNFARGDFSLFYEYRLADSYSLEAGLGVTYIDYMYELVQNNGNYFSKGNRITNGANGGVKFYSGFSGRFQCRWYPSKYETAITGYYLAPEVSYRTYKMDYFVNTGLIFEPHRLNRKYTDFKLQFGHQNADPFEKYFWEWYIAAGFRHYNEDYMEKYGIDAEFKHDDYWGPVVGGGIKIGFTL